jgi:uncharacterized protein YggU (UPF0235/DUF167 family)
MARAPALLPDAEALRARIGADGKLAVKVTPGVREESVTLTAEAVLVKVRVPADKGAANQAVLAVVAQALGMAPSRVTLLRGATSRQKILKVEL